MDMHGDADGELPVVSLRMVDAVDLSCKTYQAYLRTCTTDPEYLPAATPHETQSVWGVRSLALSVCYHLRYLQRCTIGRQ